MGIVGTLLILVIACCVLAFLIFVAILALNAAIGIVVGGVSLGAIIHDHPKLLLNFIRLGTVFAAIMCFVHYVFPKYSPLTGADSPFLLFYSYSTSLLVFHVMQHIWRKHELHNLSKPPKTRWFFSGLFLWYALVVPLMGVYYSRDLMELKDFGFFMAVTAYSIALSYGCYGWALREDSDSETVEEPVPTQGLQQISSSKDWTITYFFSIHAGIFGSDRFYSGSDSLATLKCLTVGGLGIWYLIDIILLVTGNYRDGEGNPIKLK